MTLEEGIRDLGSKVRFVGRKCWGQRGLKKWLEHMGFLLLYCLYLRYYSFVCKMHFSSLPDCSLLLFLFAGTGRIFSSDKLSVWLLRQVHESVAREPCRASSRCSQLRDSGLPRPQGRNSEDSKRWRITSRSLPSWIWSFFSRQYYCCWKVKNPLLHYLIS